MFHKLVIATVVGVIFGFTVGGVHASNTLHTHTNPFYTTQTSADIAIPPEVAEEELLDEETIEGEESLEDDMSPTDEPQPGETLVEEAPVGNGNDLPVAEDHPGDSENEVSEFDPETDPNEYTMSTEDTTS